MVDPGTIDGNIALIGIHETIKQSRPAMRPGGWQTSCLLEAQ
jgi:hypothetical protein